MTRINNRSKKFFIKHRAIWVCFFLLFFTVAVYWQITNHEFINFDDPDYVTDNRHVQTGLKQENIIWAFTTTHTGYWHPLTWLSIMLDCQLFGMNPGRHHLTSLLFHITNTISLFFVFRIMTGDFWQSGFVAALFALHPLHVESVAWVAERKDVLYAFFWMQGMLTYIWYVKRPGVIRILPVLLFFTFGLMAKPMMVTFPCVLLLLDYWPLRRLQTDESGMSGHAQQSSALIKMILEKIPFFILAAVASAATFLAQQRSGAMSSLEVLPFKARIANALISYIKYIGKMAYPSKLAILYPHPGIFPWWTIIGAFLILVSVSFLAIRVLKQSPYFFVGWLWYLGTLVPVIGLVQVGGQSSADRYTYVPLIGLFIVIAWGAPELVAQWRYRKIWLATLASVFLSILMVLTWKQVRYWENSITLFEHALKITSNSYVPHYNLGHALAKQGRTSEAVEHYLQALQLKPDHVKSHNNLGNVLAKQGRTSEAIEHYLQALRIMPDQAKAHYNLGAVFDKQGRISEAIEHYLQALRIKPDYVKAHNNLGVALFRTGNITGAITHFREALRINPDHIHAKNNLNKALKMQQQNK